MNMRNVGLTVSLLLCNWLPGPPGQRAAVAAERITVRPGDTGAVP